ncbi:hypothetical protein CLOM621_06988 [Clostridium sp. M62/1]|nr:hypothetical protein CLOM621_06988 [Clostridium sp. M62/1]
MSAAQRLRRRFKQNVTQYFQIRRMSGPDGLQRCANPRKALFYGGI